MKLKKLLSVVAAGVLVFNLVGCSNKKADVDEKTIVVGATPNPHAQILTEVVKPILEKDGYKLELKEFNDYVLPNEALNDGSLDANFFQHIPYLEEMNNQKGYELTYTVKVHIEPMGIYSDKIKDVKDLKDGAIIAVPNDPTNETRALKLLEKQGIIKLDDKKLLTKTDVKENVKNVKIKEMSAEQLTNVIQDVDLAVINSNYALVAKLNPVKDSLALESSDSPYANILAVRKDNKESEKIKELSKALNSKEVKEYIEQKYNGAIVPAF